MKGKGKIKRLRKDGVRQDLGKVMKCLYFGEQFQAVDRMTPPSDSTLATRDYPPTECSPGVSEEGEKKPDTQNIEEAELSLRESGSLNYEVCFFLISLSLVINSAYFIFSFPL